MMKHICFSVLFLAVTTTVFSQAPQTKAEWPVLKNSPDYYEVREAYLNYLEEQRVEGELFGVEMENDDYLAKFMRWDYIMRTRVDKNGNYPDPAVLFKETARYLQTHPDGFSSGSRAAAWEPVGTAMVPLNGGGVGRINVIKFDPSDSDVIYIGAAGGGVWRSTNAGEGWTPLSDNIPVTSITDIVIDPTNSDIIYIATGDGYGYEIDWQSDDDFWGGVYSAGILKSIDHGVTWLPTGLSYLQEDLMIVQRMMIHPTSPNILLAVTREGIYRTTDAADTWTIVDSTHCYDLTYDISNPDRIYAVGNKDVFVSTDAGATWVQLENNLCGSGRMTIQNTAANEDVLYCLCENGDFHKSEDDGTSWVEKENPGWTTLFWGYYDMAFDVSHLNENLVFGGGLEVVRTTNGGNSWSLRSQYSDDGDDDYVHADNHTFACHPTIENKTYAAGDGGIFVTEDNGSTWIDLSEGLRISQAYRLSTSATAPDRVLTGWQDNGSNLWDGSEWEEVDDLTYDGMEAIIDYTNEDRMFISHQYGSVYRTTDGGGSWTYMSAGFGDWVTPYVMDPVDHLVMYYGDGSGAIYKTTNGGNTWVYKNAALGGACFSIAVAPSNTDYVYACALNKVKLSDDAGENWTDITATLPHDGIGFNYLAVSDEDPQHVWVVLSGYDDGNKVFFSDNAGGTWTNISGTLPNVPVNSIVYENVTESNRIYIGTDIGVFTKDDLAPDWEPFMTDLPNVMIHEIEINYTNYKLYAATYGRGIWRSDLYDFEALLITTNVVETAFCPAEAFNVSYTATGTYIAGNIFTAQLSDASGSFASPVAIGSLESVSETGIITCTIPAGVANGTGYRIRVVSSTPFVIGTDNTFDIEINCAIPVALTSIDITATSATLEWDAATCAEEYEVQYKAVLSPDWITQSATGTSVTVSGLIPFTEYEWAVRTKCVVSPETFTDYSATETFTTLQTGIEEIVGLTGLSVYPNPMSNVATIQFSIAAGATIHITLLDIAGKEVMIINKDFLAPGSYSFELKNENLSKGVYNLQFSNGEKTAGVNLVVD